MEETHKGKQKAGANWTIERDVLLLVERKDEEHFFAALLQWLGRDDIQVKETQGKHGLLGFLKALRLDERFESVRALAVVRDADSDAALAMKSVCGSLQGCGLPVPTAHAQPSTKLSPKVVVFIMPDGKSPGMLETLCLRSVKTTGPMFCVNSLFECLDKKSCPRPKNMDKARLHAYLSTCSEPDKRLGEAARAQFWPWADDEFAAIKSFLLDL